MNTSFSNSIRRPPTGRELVVFVGLQAAGKSTFYRTHFAASHRLVSKDLLRNNRRPDRRQRQLIEQALEGGESVVVDNTHPTAASRRQLIELAQRQQVRVVAYYFASTLSKSLARNRLRTGHARVPEPAILGTFRRLERPALEEGFHELWLVKALFDEMFYVAQLDRELVTL